MSNEDLIHALDLEVIRDRTHVASETTSTREGFREKLLERDRNCVWTGLGSSFCSGMHIISHRSAFLSSSTGKLSDCHPFSLAYYSGCGKSYKIDQNTMKM